MVEIRAVMVETKPVVAVVEAPTGAILTERRDRAASKRCPRALDNHLTMCVNPGPTSWVYYNWTTTKGLSRLSIPLANNGNHSHIVRHLEIYHRTVQLREQRIRQPPSHHKQDRRACGA